MFDWFYLVSLIILVNSQVEEHGIEYATRRMHAIMTAFFVVYCGGSSVYYVIRVFVKMLAFWFYLAFANRKPERFGDADFYLLTVNCILMGKQVVAGAILTVEAAKTSICMLLSLVSVRSVTIIQCNMTPYEIIDVIGKIVECNSFAQFSNVTDCMVFEANPLQCMSRIAK